MSDFEASMTRIRSAVKELAIHDYPRVWIGEEGMTPEEYLALEQGNEEFPELRVDPGEFVTIEGDDSGAGIQVPKIGYEYLDGLYVVENMEPDMEPEQYADLSREVALIRAAKQGKVPVNVAYNVTFAKEDELAPDDRLFIRSAFVTAAGDAMAVVFVGKNTRAMPVDELAPDDVDESLIEELEFYVLDTSGPYVIEDTRRARAALEERLSSS